MIKLILLNFSLYLALAHGGILANFCNQDEFQCANGIQCIPKFNKCNLEKDCDDGSDEVNCNIVSLEQCKFCHQDNCGWQLSGEDSARDACGMAQLANSTQFTMLSQKLNTLSKQCRLEVNYQAAGGLSMVNFYRVSSGKNISIYQDANITKSITIPSGYIGDGDQIRLDGAFVNHQGVVNSLKFINCDISKIPLDCDFNANANCDWWSLSSRFTSWQYARDQDHGGYLVNKNNHLAEIRSPLIKRTGEVGVCLQFKYHMLGKEDNLEVSKVNYGLNTDEAIIWSAKNSESQGVSKWLVASIDIKSNYDFDIGFISSAYDGEVDIDDVTFKQGACQLVN